MKFIKKTYISKLIFLLIISCIEPFETTELTFENILVVEGRITNENKLHTIKLSRTFPVNETESKTEKGAKITILEDINTIYNFSEKEDGIYVSDIEFSAKPGKTYTLNIETQNDKKYISNNEELTEIAQIENVNFEVIKKEFEEEENIVNITVNTSSNNAKYFLFEYEETYKIISRFWSHLRLDNSVFPPVVVKKDKPQDSRTCYNTVFSNSILQTETSSLSKNEIVDFKIRSIAPKDFILRDRYSILVKQYVQTLNAYSYYKTLDKFSSSENVFSQSQVSFIQGNIFSETDINEKVIGYFEVNSVSEKRLFFNKEEVLVDTFSDFPEDCELRGFSRRNSEGIRLMGNALTNGYIFYNYGDIGFLTDETKFPVLLVKKACGDCTVFGSSEKPNFWID